MKITPNKIKNKVKSVTDNKISNIKYQAKQLKHIKEDYNKILHVWDTAGVASLLCRELNKAGYDAKAIMRSIHDPFGMTKYYGQESLDLEGKPFLDYAKRLAENYGVIHIHGLHIIVPEYKKIFSRKKIVLHFHGTSLTNAKDINEVIRCARKADAIICATPDLITILERYEDLPPVYLCVNPVDIDLFKPIPEIEKSDKALFVKIRYVMFDKAMEFIKQHCDWDIETFDRDEGIDDPEIWKTKGIKFQDMPKLYNKYKCLADIKPYEWLDGEIAQAISKTGLEALACGLKVLNYKGEIMKTLPIKNKPYHYMLAVTKVYDLI